MRQYKVDFLTIVEDGGIKSDCGDITFINRGFPIVLNNSLELAQNATISFSANENEIDKTIYTVRFLGSFKRLIVLRKIYTT